MPKPIVSDTRPATGALEKASSGVRHVRLRASGASLERLPDGSLLVRPDEPLGEYPKVLTDRLAQWAEMAPERICAAKRDKDGGWRTLTYSQVLAAVRSIAQALLDRGLSVERPVAILSENDLEHLLLMLAGQHAGIPTAHISPVYSLVSRDLAQLQHCFGLLTPGMVFVSNGEQYWRATEVALSDEVELVVASSPPESRKATRFAELRATNPTNALAAAHERIDPDSPAKFLFTSGSTGMPKAVINTHRMICCNQQMIAQVFGFLQDEPPVLVDWLPWNHTFGGNHNIGIALYNGGSFYIDEGKPGPGFISETIRNLREIAPTVYFNVPKGYEDLLPALRADRGASREFFQPAEAAVLCGCRTFAAGVGRVPRVGAGNLRRARGDGDGAWFDGDGADGDSDDLGNGSGGSDRDSDSWRGSEISAARRANWKRAFAGRISRLVTGGSRSLRGRLSTKMDFINLSTRCGLLMPRM